VRLVVLVKVTQGLLELTLLQTQALVALERITERQLHMVHRQVVLAL
jgi:hypothetical protein